MDIGRAIAPVCDDFQAPFAFPGRIYEVTFYLPDRRPATPPEARFEARVAVGMQ
jgi:hypothetical protein